jgi:HlyD family secretion protein
MKPSGVRLVMLGSAIALILTALGIFSYSMFRPSSQSTAASTPNSQNNEADAVSALGRLEPEGGVIKVSPASASFGNGMGGSRVERLLVKEGQTVKPSQPLAVLDTYPSQLATAMQAEAQVKEAQARLSQVEAGAKQGDINAQRATVQRANAELPKAEAEFSKADAEVQQAQWEFQRYQKLFQDGAIAESEVRNRELTWKTKEKQKQQAQQAVAQAKLTFEGAKQTLSSVAEVRPTDVQQAAAQLQVAQANFEKAKAELDKAIVRAPAEGQVLKIHTDPGEVVSSEGILELGKTKQMYVVAEVDENYISKVKPGQRAKITGFAFPGEITGTVDRVGLQVRKNQVLNTDPADKTDARIVEVKIRLDNSESVAGLTNLQVKVAIAP